MAERLATRPPEVNQETKPSEAPMDAAFADIVANNADFGKEVEHRVAESSDHSTDGESLKDSEWSKLEALERDLGLTPAPEALDADNDDSKAKPDPSTTPAVALTPVSAPTTLLAPTPAVPTTPAPSVPPSLPPAPSPKSRVKTTMSPSPDTAPPDMPPPEAPVIPPTDEHEPVEAPAPEALKMVLVDQSFDAKQAAHDAAEAKLTQELQQGGKFKRFVKGFWKGNAFRSYYLDKYKRQAETVINESQDVLAHEDSPADARARATQALIQRFGLENEEAINNAAGERQNILAGNSPMAVEAKTLLRRYANGEINDAAFQEQRREFASRHGGEVTADNMFEIAQTLKGVVEHGESLENALEGMKVISGESRSDARTQARLTATERIIERVAQSRVGSMIPRGVLGATVSIAGSVLRLGSDKAIRAALATATIGGSSAIISAIRERKRTKDERAQHTREMVMGGEIQTAPAPANRRQRFLRKLFPNRREQMEQARVESVSANDLTNTMRERMATLALDDADLPPGTTREAALRAALDALTAAETQNLITDTTQNEVLGFSSRTAARDERLQLALARAELKVALRSQMDDAMRARLATGLGLPADSSLEAIVQRQGVAVIEAVEQEATQKDRAFRKLMRKRMLTAGGITLVVGSTLGGIAQEVMAAADTQRVGLFENGGPNTVYEDGREHQTVLRGLFNGDRDATHTGASANFRETSVGDNGTWSVSDDHKMVKNSDGTYNLVDPNGKATVENFKVNPDGTMPKETEDLLRSKGMDVKPDNTIIPGETHLEPQTVNAEQHLANHAAEAPAMEVDNWMVNADPDDSDQNELKLHWTGTGVVQEPDGRNSYHMNIANMTENGSYNGAQNINWTEEAKSGNLTLRVKPLENSPQAFIVPIAPDGSINISADHPAAQYFSDKNGQASFDGHWAQVSRLNEIDANGVHHVDSLSTLIGSHEAEGKAIQDMVPVKEPDIIQPGYKITTDGYDTPGTFTEMAPFISARSRRSLEVLGRRRPRSLERPSAYYGSYYGRERYMTSAELIQRESETSPRLWDDPEANLNPYEELSWYRGALERHRGREYVEMIDRYITASPVLSSLTSPLKNIVTIPVNANGAVESESIYDRIAKQYAAQDPEALDETAFLLHVNWFEDSMQDPAQRAVIEKTRADIERAKADFPNIRIATMETEWDRGEFEAVGVIGEVGRRMTDAAMLAVQRGMDDGRLDKDVDTIVTRNDADPVGLHSHYLKNMNAAADNHPETDVFTGTTSFDNTKADRLPGMVYSGNFERSIDLLGSTTGRVHTAGGNFAVRISTLAAVGASGLVDPESGAGSDDVTLGRRIEFARTRTVMGGGTSSYAAPGGYTYAASAAGSAPASKTKRRIARRVAGARIDTDSDRSEALYVTGRPMVFAWNNGAFDTNGYADRNAGLNNQTPLFMREDIRRNPNAVLDHIQADMEGTINVAINAFGSDGLVRTALAMTFAGLKSGVSTDAYELTSNPDGSRTFRFTDIGRREVIRVLTRDERGRKDPYAKRKLRQLYGLGSAKPGQTPSSRRVLLAA